MLNRLGDMTVAEFLSDYWQKKPLLIRQLFPDFQCPLDHNDLAGLSLEEDVESRIVFEEYEGKPWHLLQGPFEPEFLETLPDSNWTLLIQGLDHWVPEIADLLDQFRFLPNWRIDDIMASFAPVGGSVGAHYDQYDVFLIQAEGHRRWQVGPPCDANSPRIEGTPLRILSDMQVEQEWVLAPGDVLYLPPAYAHYGVAMDHCITLSVGFRSPTRGELLSSLADHWLEHPASQQHIQDMTEAPLSNPGHIDPRVISGFRDHLNRLLADEQDLARWFGSFITAPKHDGIVEPVDSEERLGPDEVKELFLVPEVEIRWNEGSRYAWQNADSACLLFVDGETFTLQPEQQPLAEALCLSNRVDKEALEHWLHSEDNLQIVTRLFNQGSLRISTDDELEDWGEDES